MNATLQEIKLKDIVITGENSRSKFEIKDLKKSIADNGVICPVHVVKNGKGFILKAGERRVRACNELKLEAIPALVLDDADGVMYLENSHRKPLTVLEKLGAISQLSSEINDPERLSAVLGVPKSQVAALLFANDGLCPEVKKLVKTDEDFRDWTPAMFSLLARQSEVCQLDIIGSLYIDEVTHKELRNEIDRYNMNLSEAPWEMDETLDINYTVDFDGDERVITPCKNCVACPDNSANKASLFPEDKSKLGVCTNDICFKHKYAQKMLECATSIHCDHKVKPVGLFPDGTYNVGYPTDALNIIITQTGRLNEHYTKLKSENSKDAVPAMWLLGKDAGKLVWVKSKAAKPNKKADDSTEPIKKKASEMTLKEKMAELVKKRHKGTCERIIELIGKMTWSDCILTNEKLAYLAGLVGTQRRWLNLKQCIGTYKCIAVTQPNDAYYAALWKETKATICADLEYGGTIIAFPKDLEKATKALCEMLAIEYDDVFKDISKEKGYTVPKAWGE